MVTYTGKVFYTTATNKHNRVLLQVVTLAGDVGVNLLAIGKTHTRHLSHSRVRLLRGCSVNANAHTTTLGT